MNNNHALNDKTAIVTGASSGIGLATARTLARAGAAVFLAGRTAEPMEKEKSALEAEGYRVFVLATDLRRPENVHALVDQAVAETGRLDIMVNNAGVEYPATLLGGNPEHWQTMLETNVLALAVGCQAAVRAMRSCEAQGHIVNISSVTAQRNATGMYGATKHAVNVLSATLREELEHDTIRVVNVMPGATSTNFARHFPPTFSERLTKAAGIAMDRTEEGHLPEAALEQLAQKMKQNLCSPEDVARTILFAITQPIEVNIADVVVRPPVSVATWSRR